MGGRRIHRVRSRENNTHVSQRYFQAAEDLSVFFLMFLSKFSSSDEVYDVSIS